MRLPDRAPRKVNETTTLHDIREALNAMPGVRIFRNNVGQLKDHTGRWVKYGLCDGSADLIGITRVSCPTCGVHGRFTAIEVKSPTDNRGFNENQEKWHRAMVEFAPIIGVATSVAEAVRIVEAGS